MNRATSVPYRLKFTSPYRYKLQLYLLRYTIAHYLMCPYHVDIPSIGYRVPDRIRRNRRRTALYDAMYNILLDSFTSVTGATVSAATGQMLFLLIDLTRALDEYLDEQPFTVS